MRNLYVDRNTRQLVYAECTVWGFMNVYYSGSGITRVYDPDHFNRTFSAVNSDEEFLYQIGLL